MRKIMFAACVCALALTVVGCRDFTPDLHDTYIITFHHGTNPTTGEDDPPTTLQTDIRGRLPRIPSYASPRPGFRFEGWFIVGGNEQVTLQTIFHRDTDVYARWIPLHPRQPGPLEQALLDLRGTTQQNITISLTAEQVGIERIMPQTLSFGGQEIHITLDGYNPNGDDHRLRLANAGAMFTVGDGVTLTLQNIMLEGFVETIGGRSLHNTESLILVKDGGTLIIEDGATIARNWNRNIITRRGGGISILTGGEATMNGGLIEENRAGVSGAGGFLGFGGGVFVDGGKFTMNGGVIERNWAFIGIGGGVYVNRAGLFVKNDGQIRNNAANRGGGVGVGGHRYKLRGDCGVIDCVFCAADNSSRSIAHYSVFEMVDGRIFDNFGVEGGGVDVHNLARFYMRGGAIDYNDAFFGAGILNFLAHVNIDGGTISRSMAWMGSGIFNMGTLSLHSGFIQGNYVDLMGGGVFNDRWLGDFTMFGGTIQGNQTEGFTSSLGGGVFNAGGFIMHGGTITGNSAVRGSHNLYNGPPTSSQFHRNRAAGLTIITGGNITAETGGGREPGGVLVGNYQGGLGTGAGVFRGLQGFYSTMLPPLGSGFIPGDTACGSAPLFWVPQPADPARPWRGISVGRPIMGHSVLDENNLFQIHMGSIVDCTHPLCINISGSVNDHPAHLHLATEQPYGWLLGMGIWGDNARLADGIHHGVNMTTPPGPFSSVLPPGGPSPAVVPDGASASTPPAAFIAPTDSNLSSSMYFSIFDQHGNIINPEFAGYPSSVLDRLRSFFGDDLLAARHSMDSVMNPWPLGGR